MDRFVIISGCSGGGKSALLDALRLRGYAVIEEPGRRIVTRELDGGGHALPWVDGVAFARKAMELSLEDREAASQLSGWVFFDRGLIDAAAALQHLTGERLLDQLCQPHRYNKHVFLTPPWPEIYETDQDRRHSFAEAVAEYVPQWMALKEKIDAERYQQVLALFNFQAGHALVWRDAINNWFARTSGVEDVQGRVGHDPNRIEAEAMRAKGYELANVTPWETASGGKAVVCHVAAGCTVAATIDRPAGLYDVAIQYFDTWRGTSRYELLVNDTSSAAWKADDTLPPAQFDPNMDGQDSTRFTAHSVALRPGDTLTVHGVPDLRTELNNKQTVRADAGSVTPDAQEQRDYREYAPIDYIEIGPNSGVTPQ